MAELDAVPEDWDRCLAVVAHPDDLEYGSSCALARWTAQGKTVVEVLATRGEAGIEGLEPIECARVRTAEQIAGAAAVGVETVEFLDFADGSLVAGLDLRRALARAIRRHRPEVVVTLTFRDQWSAGSSWNHADHRAVGLSVVDAVRDAGNRWVFRELVDEGHEPWSGVRFVLAASSPESRHFVDVTESLEAGIASLRAHQAYIDGLGGDFDPATFLRGMAEPTGERAGVAAAVPFELIPT
jgi:LmbE family N-acetylglucosaminyl deacetylase